MSEGFFILAASLLPLSLGVFLSYRVFRIPDITTDGSFSLGGAVLIWALQAGLPMYLAITIAGITGAIAGLCTGGLYQKFKIPALLAGVLVMGALFSINLLITGRANLPIPETSEPGNSFGDPKSYLWFITGLSVLLFLLFYFFLKTDFGLAMRAAGSNGEAAQAQGIAVSMMQITGLCIANGLTAISGAMMVLSQGFWDINMGTGIIIAGMAAVMMAEAVAGKKHFFLHALLLLPCTLLYRWIIALVLSFGMEPVYVKLVTSILVTLIFGFTYFRNKEGA